MSRAAALALLVTVAATAAAGCAKPRIQLPSGPSTPLDDPRPMLASAFGHCRDLESLTFEASLSGRAGGRRLRARLLAGLARPSSIRLEAVAPFGPPGFILAASPSSSVLLLPRDDRVLRDAPPAEILEAMAGVAVAPEDLLAYLSGCPGRDPAAEGARRYGDTWVAVDVGEGDKAVAYLRRDGGWRPAAIERPGLRVLFEEWEGGQPVRVRLQDPSTPPSAATFDLLLRLSQVERNVRLTDAAFSVDVPAEAAPLTLDELREAGPMRDAPPPDRPS